MKYISEREAISLFDDYLNEVNNIIVICGMEYLPSRILEELDPTAYSCLFNDWLDFQSLTTDEDEADEDEDEDEDEDGDEDEEAE